MVGIPSFHFKFLGIKTVEILFIIGLTMLSLNVLRFIIGNYGVIKGELPGYIKVWNVVESIWITVIFVILVLNYYK